MKSPHRNLTALASSVSARSKAGRSQGAQQGWNGMEAAMQPLCKARAPGLEPQIDEMSSLLPWGLTFEGTVAFNIFCIEDGEF